MDKDEAASLVRAQRDFFLSGATRDLDFRIFHLEKLGQVFKRREAEMYRAVRQDMGRAELETFFMEVFSNQEELEHALKNLHDWTRPRREKTPTLFFRSQSMIHPEPFGVALIISAWNFPLL
ncbi:MAG TPA: aldehyde dehydrogenase family protein, partial [Polyangia bacterium]